MPDLSTRQNRTLKLALDDGSAASIEEAVARFREFRICVDVRESVPASPGLEAALLTLLNAGPRTFLGGVEVTGDVTQRLSLAWFEGMSVADVARSFGASVTNQPSPLTPTVLLGPDPVPDRPFALSLQCGEAGFCLSPEGLGASSPRAEVECGVAAAGAALSEAFRFVYSRHPLAGRRRIRFTLPTHDRNSPERSLWAIGLGHLGQAALWSLALRPVGRPKSVRLQDPDSVTESNVSTCLLSGAEDVGRPKVDVVAGRLEELGIRCTRVPETLTLPREVREGQPEAALVSVDNVELRRSLDSMAVSRVIEGGIGDGIDAFTRVQIHVLPGPRPAADIWASGDARASRVIDISAPAYQHLLKTEDECGITTLAGQSIATPFVGAFAGACMAVVSGRCGTQSDWSLDVGSL